MSIISSPSEEPDQEEDDDDEQDNASADVHTSPPSVVGAAL
jgi:hypothetical protein